MSGQPDADRVDRVTAAVAADQSACLTCVAWVGRLSSSILTDLADIAADRGVTIPQARQLLLAAYHAHHQQEDTHGVDQESLR